MTFRLRFHGRGGQGMKTAARVVGTAFFNEGFEVQDAPRYGAERRGAPIFAYVRANRGPIYERGIIADPDLVAVADETLVQVAAAGVTAGLDERATLLIVTGETAETWSARLKRPGRILTLAPTDGDGRGDGLRCAGAASRLVGVIGEDALRAALSQELGPLGTAVLDEGVRVALSGYEEMAALEGSVNSGGRDSDVRDRPDWVDLSLEDADVAAPAIHAGSTSEVTRTGLWRTARPVLLRDDCHRCIWVCSTLCPDNAITADGAGYPAIDLDHCKGCMICVAQCPFHAIEGVPERGADAIEKKEVP